MIADPRERIVDLLDFKTGRSRRVAREGSGPLEYLQPVFLVGIGIDTTLVFDAEAQRYLVVDGTGVASRSESFVAEGLKVRATSRIALQPRAFDAFGNIYFEAPVLAGGILPQQSGDSLLILRYSRRSARLDTLASVHGADGYVTTKGSAKDFRTRVGFRSPYAPGDGWTATSDGRIAILHPEPYHVEFIFPSGRRTIGPELPYRALEVKDADLVELAAVSARLGERNVGSSLDRKSVIDDYRGPRVKPPFWSGGVRARPNGQLWVWRYAAGGLSETVFDVIGVDGNRATQWKLPPQSQLLLLGEEALYLTRFSPDDLQTVMRCEYPSQR